MPVQLAREIIQREVEYVRNSSDYDALEIDFMGGEPMTNFSLIKEVVEWAEQEPFDIPLIFFLTTNGTLFDDEAKDWFIRHKESVVAGASYDGTEEMQNVNRATMKTPVDLEFFHNTWPYQEFHMTISKESLQHLAEGILSLQRKGYPLTASLAQGVDWNESDAEIYERELHKLIAAYTVETDLQPINLLSNPFRILDSAQISGIQQEKWCGTGTAMATYDVDGKVYGCHMFSPIVLGPKAIESKEIDFSCSAAVEDPFCSKCVLKLSCPTCAGFNYRYRGDISTRDHRWCRMMLIQLRAACEFQIKVISRSTDELDAESAIRAKLALQAYSILNSFDVNIAESPYLYE